MVRVCRLSFRVWGLGGLGNLGSKLHSRFLGLRVGRGCGPGTLFKGPENKARYLGSSTKGKKRQQKERHRSHMTASEGFYALHLAAPGYVDELQKKIP